MEKRRLLFLLSFGFLLSSPDIAAEAGCPGGVGAVQYHSLPRSHIGVSARVNRSGPYEFMVDTGAQITVIEPRLAEELKLERTGTRRVATVASFAEVPVVKADAVEVGPASVKGLEMAVEALGPVQAEWPKLRGILGTNFLSRFDVLYDYGHKRLCLDEGRSLQGALRGERVPLVWRQGTISGEASMQALLVAAHVADDGPGGSVLRIDSGSNVPVLYVDRAAKARVGVQSRRVGGNTIGVQAQFTYSYTPERNVRLGRQKEMQIAFATPNCSGCFYSKPGEDGVLPTMLFKRVFISAADHFVIFDPI